MPAYTDGASDKAADMLEQPASMNNGELKTKWDDAIQSAVDGEYQKVIKALELLPSSPSPSHRGQEEEEFETRQKRSLRTLHELHQRRSTTYPAQSYNQHLDKRRRKKHKEDEGHDDNGFDDGSWRGDKGGYGPEKSDSSGDEDTGIEQGDEAYAGYAPETAPPSSDSQVDYPSSNYQTDSEGNSGQDTGVFQPGPNKIKFKSPGNDNTADSTGSSESQSATGWHAPDESLTRPKSGQEPTDSSSRMPEETSSQSEDEYGNYGDPLLPDEADGSSRAEDCTALKQFFDDMSGPDWVDNSGWTNSDRSKYCCNAFGVSCSLDNRVTALDLGGNGLAGPLSPAVFKLRYLNRLNFSSNAISSSLPDQFDKLPRLTTLYLDQNKMTGPLPLTLQHSTSVSSVHLTSNAFEGLLTFPNASNLTQLYVSKNKFTDLAINANQALLKAALDDNQFNCTLPDLQGFPSLQVLSVARNQFQGSIPNVTGLRQLLKLDLQANALSGTFPDVTSLPKLQYLGLNGNSDLSGPFPTGPAPPNLVTCHVDTLLASSCPGKAVLADSSSLASKCSLRCRGGGRPANATKQPDSTTSSTAQPPQADDENTPPANERSKMMEDTGLTPAALAASLSGHASPIVASHAASLWTVIAALALLLFLL